MSGAPPELDLDDLMARIRTKTEPSGREPEESGPDAGPPMNKGPERTFALSARDLLALPETEFVRACYLAFRGREAEPEELARQRDRLLTWQVSRLRIVREIRASSEARNYGGRVEGLSKVLARDRLYWSPPAKAGRFVARLFQFLRDLPKRLDAVEQAGRHAAAVIAALQSGAAADRHVARNQARHMQERMSAIRQVIEEARNSLSLRSDAIERTAAALAARANATEFSIVQAQSDLANLDIMLADQRTALVDHWRAILDQKLRTEALLSAAQPNADSGDRRLSRQMEREKEHLLDPLYLSFEDRYRGSRDDVKERQRVYLPRVEECVTATERGAAVDIGCGRGEWLELMAEAGIAAQGFDLNRIAVEECRARGLDVVLEDGIEALRRLPESTLSAITSFHVIEHLPFETLISLLDHALHVLRPGGILILETPNPANLLVAAERFYYDPTHRNPLPSELVSYLVKSRGFERVEIVPLHPANWPESRDYEDPMLALLQKKLFGPQDYGVVGWKAA